MAVDAVSTLIVISLLQGSILIFLLLFQKGKLANGYLAGILVFLLWTQFEFLFVRNRIQFGFVLLFATRLGSWLILGPLFLCYTKSLLNSEFKLNFKGLLHFLPFVVFTLIVPFVVKDLIPDRAVHYGILSLLKYYHMGTTPIQAMYAILFGLQFMHLLSYLMISKRRLSEFSKELKSQYSNLDKINTNWINNLTNAFLLVLISVTIFFVTLFVFNIYKREFDYFYVLPFALVIYWVTYKILKHPEIIRSFSLSGESNIKYLKSSLTPNQATSYKHSIESYMTSQKPHLNNELKLNDLAEALDMPSHHLSQVLNDQFKLSFFDFINEYRVEEAKQRLMKKNGETILQIAYEVGFNNKASFNNYFKKITHQTPSEFIRYKKNQKMQ